MGRWKMIELNLLPKELRKKKKRAFYMPRIPVRPVVAGAASVLIAAHVLLALLVMNSEGLLKALEEKWDGLKPQREKTEKVVREIADLEKRISAVRRVAEKGLNWTKILSGLNRAVVPNIWLSDFEPKFHRDEAVRREMGNLPITLGITGYALGGSDEATSAVAKFITSLKENKDFSEYFEAIELQNIRSREIAGEEVMMFNLNCRFKMPESVSGKGKTGRKKKKRR